MRQIERTGQFKRDYKREAKGQHRATLDADLVPVLVALADDQPLEPRHRDHALTGDWKDHRDCHIKPDLVLALTPNSACDRRGPGPASHVSLTLEGRFPRHRPSWPTPFLGVKPAAVELLRCLRIARPVEPRRPGWGV